MGSERALLARVRIGGVGRGGGSPSRRGRRPLGSLPSRTGAGVGRSVVRRVSSLVGLLGVAAGDGVGAPMVRGDALARRLSSDLVAPRDATARGPLAMVPARDGVEPMGRRPSRAPRPDGRPGARPDGRAIRQGSGGLGDGGASRRFLLRERRTVGFLQRSARGTERRPPRPRAPRALRGIQLPGGRGAESRGDGALRDARGSRAGLVRKRGVDPPGPAQRADERGFLGRLARCAAMGGPLRPGDRPPPLRMDRRHDRVCVHARRRAAAPRRRMGRGGARGHRGRGDGDGGRARHRRDRRDGRRPPRLDTRPWTARSVPLGRNQRLGGDSDRDARRRPLGLGRMAGVPRADRGRGRRRMGDGSRRPPAARRNAQPRRAMDMGARPSRRAPRDAIAHRRSGLALVGGRPPRRDRWDDRRHGVVLPPRPFLLRGGGAVQSRRDGRVGRRVGDDSSVGPRPPECGGPRGDGRGHAPVGVAGIEARGRPDAAAPVAPPVRGGRLHRAARRRCRVGAVGELEWDAGRDCRRRPVGRPRRRCGVDDRPVVDGFPCLRRPRSVSPRRRRLVSGPEPDRAVGPVAELAHDPVGVALHHVRDGPLAAPTVVATTRRPARPPASVAFRRYDVGGAPRLGWNDRRPRVRRRRCELLADLRVRPRVGRR